MGEFLRDYGITASSSKLPRKTWGVAHARTVDTRCSSPCAKHLGTSLARMLGGYWGDSIFSVPETWGSGDQGPGPEDLQLLRQIQIQLLAICADIQAQTHSYIIALSMQVSFAQRINTQPCSQTVGLGMRLH